MRRVVEPELLDELPSDAPEALRSRRDLIRLNAWMGNARCAANEIRRIARRGKIQLADIGGGDGKHALSVVQRLPGYSGEILIVDRNRFVPESNSFERLGWRVRAETADVFEWTRHMQHVDVVLANLFLHHFHEPELRNLFALVGERTNAFMSVEPCRGRLALTLARLLWAIGCNRVTRHDAVISVRAGFTGHELSALWPEREKWALREHGGGFSSHVFSAFRRSHQKGENN